MEDEKIVCRRVPFIETFSFFGLPSKTQLRRFLEQGAVYYRMDDEWLTVSSVCPIIAEGVYRLGKKKFIKIKLT